MKTINLENWTKEKDKLSFDEGSHTYYWDGEKIKGSVSSVIEPLSPYKDNDIDPAVLEAAGVRGTLVHKWIEDYFNNVKGTMIATYQPYVDAFLKWTEAYGDRFKILYSELQLYNPADNYAGTIDAIIYDTQLDEIGILDFKTNSVKIDALVTTQTAGYATMLEYWTQEPIKKAFVLYLSKEGEYDFKPINLDEGRIRFKQCLEIWNKEEQ